MTIFFDKLIDRYLPTNEGWYFHPDNTAQLTTTEEDSKLVIDEVNPLTSTYKQLMFTSTSSSGNSSVYYLDMVATAGGTLPEIVRDLAASNAKAIAIGPDTRMIFRTNYPYNKDRLKKVLCRVRNVDSTAPIQVGVCGIRDEAYVQPDGSYGFEMYPIVIDGAVTSEYVTYVGYLLGTDTLTNIAADTRPNNDVDFPAPLLDGTTDIALSIKVGSGTGYYHIDSIELQDTENDLTDLPGGTAVVNMIHGMSDDDKLTPVEKNYLVTLMSELVASYGDEDGTPVVGIYYAGVQAGVSSTLLSTLSAKYNALYDAMYGTAGWLTTLTDITDIDGTVFNALFDEYYAAKVAVEQTTVRLNTSSLVLIADTTVITTSSRGELKTQEVVFSLEGHNITFSDVSWVRSDYGDPEDGFEFMYDLLGNIDYTRRFIDASTVLSDNITVTVTYSLGSRELTSTLALATVVDGLAGPLYLGTSSTIPLITEEGNLISKDFFLYTGSYIGVNTSPDSETAPEAGVDVVAAQNNEFIKGRMYRYLSEVMHACTVPQTAASTIILSNTDIALFPIGMHVLIAGEASVRTITNVTAYDTNNMAVAVSGDAFDSAVGLEVYLDVWVESRNSSDLALASKDALEIARNTNDWIYAAVVIAQLGLFNDLLVEGKLSSVNYKEYTELDMVTDEEDPNFGKIIGLDGREHTIGEPKEGFLLDGPSDIIKAFAMEAYNSKIFGSIEATGFKTIEGSAETIIPIEEVPKTLYKYSDMTDLIADQEAFATLSGIVEGYSFDRATKRNNTKILMGSHGYEGNYIDAQEAHIFTKLNPDRFFGNTFSYSTSGYLDANNSYRVLYRMSENCVLEMSTTANAIFLQSSGMAAEGLRSWSRGSYSGTGTLTLDTTYTRAAMVHASYRWWDWGGGSSYVNGLKLYTNRTFNGLVLRNGNTSFAEYSLRPNAYYPNTKTFTIGANTQATLLNHYVSGTDFYNLFSELSDLADGYLSSGKIKIRTIGGVDTEYTCTRLVKDGTGINFYTGFGIVRVDIFNEGTSQGVYEYLKITEDFTYQPIPDGIEVKSILPWGTLAGTPTNVSVGTVDSRFESAFFKHLDILTSARLRDTLQVDGTVNSNYINTGDGSFKIGQNLRKTDSVEFAKMISGKLGINATTSQSVAARSTSYGDNLSVTLSAIGVGDFCIVTFGQQQANYYEKYDSWIWIYLPAGSAFVVQPINMPERDIIGTSSSTNDAHCYTGMFSGGRMVAYAHGIGSNNSDNRRTGSIPNGSQMGVWRVI